MLRSASLRVLFSAVLSTSLVLVLACKKEEQTEEEGGSYYFSEYQRYECNSCAASCQSCTDLHSACTVVGSETAAGTDCVGCMARCLDELKALGEVPKPEETGELEEPTPYYFIDESTEACAACASTCPPCANLHSECSVYDVEKDEGMACRVCMTECFEEGQKREPLPAPPPAG